MKMLCFEEKAGLRVEAALPPPSPPLVLNTECIVEENGTKHLSLLPLKAKTNEIYGRIYF